MRPEQNLDNFPEIFSPLAFRGLHLALIIEQMNLWNDSNHILSVLSLYCGLRYHIVWWSNLTWNVRFRSIRVFLCVRVRRRSMTKLNETYSSDWVRRLSSKTECSIWYPRGQSRLRNSNRCVAGAHVWVVITITRPIRESYSRNHQSRMKDYHTRLRNHRSRRRKLNINREIPVPLTGPFSLTALAQTPRQFWPQGRMGYANANGSVVV